MGMEYDKQGAEEKGVFLSGPHSYPYHCLTGVKVDLHTHPHVDKSQECTFISFPRGIPKLTPYVTYLTSTCGPSAQIPHLGGPLMILKGCNEFSGNRHSPFHLNRKWALDHLPCIMIP